MSDIDAIRGYQPKGEGGTFLKLADKEEVKLRLFSLPVIFQNEFRMGDDVTISTRFGFVVWNHDIGKAQVWVTNAATYGQQISPLLEDEDYGDWREYDVKLMRTGEKAQTRYHVRPGVKRYELDDEAVKSCENIDLIGMIKKGEGASHVMWLSEFRALEANGEKLEDPGYAKEKKQAEDLVKRDTNTTDEVPEDISDEPINLDDIPF